MNKFIAIALLLFLGMTGAASAQASLKDPDNFNPDLPCVFVIDLAKCTAQVVSDMIAAAEAGTPLYIWTWAPGGDAERADSLKNGEWSSSNDSLYVKYKGNGIVEFDLRKLSPAKFYNVDAKTVYDNDFSLLIKMKDGGAKLNGNEPKTEDLKISVEPPSFRLFSIPPRKAPTNDSTFSRATEVMTIYYDNKLETTAAMQGVQEVIVFYKVTLSNGQVVTPLTFAAARNNEALLMTPQGNGIFRVQLIPDQFFRQAAIDPNGKIPAGEKITAVECQFVKRNSSTTAAPPNFKVVFSDCP